MLVKILRILLRVAFITLFERKILGLSQNRIGPNKIRVKGVLQPVFDGVKLFLKEFFFSSKRIYSIFFVGPIISFTVIIII